MQITNATRWDTRALRAEVHFRADIGLASDRSTWTNIGTDAIVLGQATSGLRPALSTIKSAAALDFEGDYLDATCDASVTDVLHNGDPCTLLVVIAPRALATYDAIVCTARNLVGNTGLHINVAADGRMRGYCSNGGAAFTWQRTTAAGVITTTRAHSILITQSTADGYALWIDGALNYADAFGAAASVSHSTYALRVGDGPLGGFDFSGAIAEIMIMRRVATAADRALIDGYCAHRYFSLGA